MRFLWLVAALAAWPAQYAIAQNDIAYPLGPNDQIDVSIYGQAGDKATRTRVRSDGSITLPLIGRIEAAGRDAGTLASDVERKLKSGGFVLNPIVNVEVVEYVSRSVTVLGAVGTPGIYPLDRPQTLGTLLARAGGVRDIGNDLVVLRHARDNKVERLAISALAVDGSRDARLQPGDTVYVPEADHYYIYGQVSAPGGYPIARDMTIRQALARGGGPTLSGSERRVTLYHGHQPPVDANLDSLIAQGDVLFIRERTF